MLLFLYIYMIRSVCVCCHAMQQVCEAARYLHDQDITHRDLKLENLLLDQSYHVKLCDFGFTKSDCVKDLSRLVAGVGLFKANKANKFNIQTPFFMLKVGTNKFIANCTKNNYYYIVVVTLVTPGNSGENKINLVIILAIKCTLIENMVANSRRCTIWYGHTVHTLYIYSIYIYYYAYKYSLYGQMTYV